MGFEGMDRNLRGKLERIEQAFLVPIAEDYYDNDDDEVVMAVVL